LVKVWHPDRFPNDLKLRKKAEEKLKQVNAAFQHLNSSADTPPARAESAAKKPEKKPESQKPYEAPKGATRASQSSSASEKEAPRPHASAQEPPRQDAPASGFPKARYPEAMNTPDAFEWYRRGLIAPEEE
jgi:curved DNA-binding protein CbpA